VSTPVSTLQRQSLAFVHHHLFRDHAGNKPLFQIRGGSDRLEGPSVQEPELWVEPKRALVLMDVFSEYHGIFLSQQARLAYGVATISVLSEYMKGYFEREAPDELDRWKKEFLPSEDNVQEWKDSVKDVELVAIVCESDSGLADAERFGNLLNLSCHNGFNEARRNKFLMIEALREAGLEVVRQQLCENVEQAIAFAEELGVHSEAGENMVVVKPVRGVASDDVHLCKDLSSVKQAFAKIHGSPVFGSPWEKHAKVLVQEFAVGQEFAIDMVCKNGEKKIAAIWKYDKRPANGAPFVYFATEIYDGEHNQILYDYLSQALDALDIRWGLTHSEIILTSKGPRLVEVNCRQHNMDFLPIVMASIGYNAFDMLLAAYLGENSKEDFPSETAGLRLDWDLLPHIPTRRMKGAMVHLSCFVSGKLKSVNERALYEIQQMESVLDLEVYGYFLQVGNQLEKTIDIRTDCGWVQMVNPSGDSESFERDFQRIVELMPTIFEVDK
jgi:predicted ATP-grasp superfamily ATP-dependent carboligase